MSSIKNLKTEYTSKIGYLDTDLIIADVLKKPREFILTHPEYKVSKTQLKKIELKITRRAEHKPLAYILGHKEFYGLDFKVNKHTLIPRPETELLVELAIQEIKNNKQTKTTVDVGTGSGNIIISLACNMKHETYNKINFYGVDISQKALAIAKYNAKKNKLADSIKFIGSDLLEYFISNHSSLNGNLIILANLPYLSQKIYNSAEITVKKYEPKSALYSAGHGLDHYAKLLEQLKTIKNEHKQLETITCFFEFSPEQKTPFQGLIKKHFPRAKISFFKDLAGKWRIVKIAI